jgi:hypothetical protein
MGDSHKDPHSKYSPSNLDANTALVKWSCSSSKTESFHLTDCLFN